MGRNRSRGGRGSSPWARHWVTGLTFWACTSLPLHAATIRVSTGADRVLGCATNPARPCSLREALTIANSSAGADVIVFALNPRDDSYDARRGVWIIELGSPLPALTDDATTIDATTVRSAPARGSVLAGCDRPRVELTGTNIGHGLEIRSNENRIQGLSIYGFRGPGILITGSNNWLSCNFVGTTADERAGVGNQTGIQIDFGGATNHVGETPTLVKGRGGNLISGNARDGVRLEGQGTGSFVQANLIGVGSDGTTKLSNGGSGVYVGPFGGRHQIGSDEMTPQTENNRGRQVISGNGSYGVDIRKSDGNKVMGNFIGVGASGSSSVGNGDGGVLLEGAQLTVVGGSVLGARNVISANPVGILSQWSTPANLLPTQRLSKQNQIAGNLIGTDDQGQLAIPNGVGVHLRDFSEETDIGGPTGAEANVISGNSQAGVIIEGGSHTNSVRSNFIGIGKGAQPLPNGMGVILRGGSNENEIGGRPEWMNVIAQNQGDGVLVDGKTTVDNAIEANSIHSNGGKGIHLSNGAHGSQPWVRIWESSPLGGGDYQIAGQVDPDFPNPRVSIYSDRLDQGEYTAATLVATDPLRRGWFTAIVQRLGQRFTFTVSDAKGRNTSEFLTSGAPSHVGSWPFDMDYWQLDPDNGLPLNPRYHGGWTNWPPKAQIVNGFFQGFGWKKGPTDIPNVAHNVFHTGGFFCGFFMNHSWASVFTGDLYWESFFSGGFGPWSDADNNVGLRTPLGSGTDINTQRYFNPDPSVGPHDRLECPSPPHGCDANDWPSPALPFITSYLQNSGNWPLLTLEIDRGASFDKWNSHPYWEMFDGVKGGTFWGKALTNGPGTWMSNADLAQLVDGKRAVAIGSWTLDCYHGCRAELHPIYAMAVRESTSAAKDVWHFFFRNEGNQAVCGGDVYFSAPQGWSWYLRLPGRSGGATITTSNAWSHEEDGKVSWGVYRSGNDVVIKATLPSREDWLVGTVTIAWN